MASEFIYFGDPQIWYNGKIMPSSDARVHVLTHGLHYGSCVFEGERAYDGHVFKSRKQHRAPPSLGRDHGLHDPLFGRRAGKGEG